MANTNTVIQIKYSDVTAIPPSLNTAELAYSNVSNKLWINDGSGVVSIAGKYYTDIINSASPTNDYGTLVLRSGSGDFEGNIIRAVDLYSRNFNLLERTNVIFEFANTIANTADDSAFNHANGAYIQANAAYDKANSAPGNSGDIILNTSGEYATAPNLNYNSSSQTLYANNINLSNNVEANNVIAYNRFFAGVATQLATPVPYLIAQFTGNTKPYVQVNLQNIEPEGSGDSVVTSDVGTDETFYITTGMQGSQLEQGALFPLDGYVLVQGNTSQVAGNLVIGTISETPGQKTRIVSGGHEIANIVAEFGSDIITFIPEITSPTTRRISIHANAAFDSANNVFPQVQPAFIQANSAFDAQNTTGRYANSAYLHANASYVSQNTTGIYANSAYLQANSAYVSQNTTGVYANTAYLHANSAYVSQNTTGVYANAAYSAANVADQRAVTSGVYANNSYIHANSAYVSQNTTGVYANSAYTAANVADQRAVTSGVYANTAYLHANAAFASANNVFPQVQPAFIQANSAFDAANVANQRAVTSGSYANSAYALANTKFASAGGSISGDVNITGNLIVTGGTVYANTTTVNLGDAIITLNADIPPTQAPTENAGIEIDRGSSANTVLLWNETTDKWTFTNDGTNYSNIGSAAAESYANSAYLQANSAYLSQNSSGQYANSAYLHANSAYLSQNSSGQYANSAYLQANAAFIKANTAAGSDGQIQLNISGAFGATANLRFSNTTNTLTTNNVTAIANIAYANTTATIKVYQYYNESSGSLDTVFL